MAKSKVRKIIESMVSSEPTDNWYLQRREICNGCPHNTKNGAKVISDADEDITAIIQSRNFLPSGSTETCSKCTCSIPLKTPHKDEFCPVGSWGIQETVSDFYPNTKGFKITPNDVSLKHAVNEYGFSIDHGKVENNQTSCIVKGEFEISSDRAFHIQALKPTCGCTTTSVVEVSKDGKKHKIKYSIEVYSQTVHTKTINIQAVFKSKYTSKNDEKIVPVKINFIRDEL